MNYEEKTKMINFLNGCIRNGEKVIVKNLRAHYEINENGVFKVNVYTLNKNNPGDGLFRVNEVYSHSEEREASDYELYIACENVIRERLFKMSLKCRYGKTIEKGNGFTRPITYLQDVGMNLEISDYMSIIFKEA